MAMNHLMPWLVLTSASFCYHGCYRMALGHLSESGHVLLVYLLNTLMDSPQYFSSWLLYYQPCSLFISYMCNRWPDIYSMKVKDKNFGIETATETVLFKMVSIINSSVT